MTAGLSLAIPCRADEPGLDATLESLLEACRHSQLPPQLLREVVICINGLKLEEVCAPLTAVREFCARLGVPVEEVWVEPDDRQAKKRELGKVSTDLPFPSFIVLLTERKGKPPAWNTLWRWTRGEMVLFCDADVRVEREAVYHLYTGLQKEPQLRLVAAREVPVLQTKSTWWSRMGALPYRFDFGNAGGRLYLIWKNALSGTMPEDLLLEDAWLTMAVSRRWVMKEPCAQVFFLPPATWRDCFAERIRTEGGKLQLRREHKVLLAEGPVAQYRWSQFWQRIAFREYPLVACLLTLRLLARFYAWMTVTRKDFYSLYRPFSSTKAWAPTRQ